MNQFVSFGMYAFTPQLQTAWQALYSVFLTEWKGSVALDNECRWDHDVETLAHSSLFFGHTCGYPLTHQLKNRVKPFCVPEFDIEGCEGIYYSSQFIVPATSDLTSLQQCRGKRVGINSPDSNSGMNVLRHAIAPLAEDKSFFGSITKTGGHLSSMQMVARGDIDLAAIDAVSYRLAIDAYPELATQTRSIGKSAATASLPLVYPASNQGFDHDKIRQQLNKALTSCDPWVARTLRIKNFLPVTLADYDSIVAIEQQAIELGYPVVR